MSNPVVHFEINTKHPRRSQAFYGKLFAWSIDANNPMQYGLVKKTGKGGIGGGIAAVEKGAKPFVTVYVQVKSITTTLRRVRQLGGKVIVPRTVIPQMVTFGMFRDLDGNIIGVIE